MMMREVSGVRRSGFGAFCRLCGAWFIARTTNRKAGGDFYCGRRCSQTANAHKSSAWRAFVGRTKNDSKYVEIGQAPHRQHRAVLAEVLGRTLRSDEIVHHIDGNKANNDPTNLVIMSRQEHSRFHIRAAM